MHRFFQGRNGKILDWDIEADQGIWRDPYTGEFVSITTNTLRWAINYRIEISTPAWAVPPELKLQEGL